MIEFRIFNYQIELVINKIRLSTGGREMNEGLFDVREIANWFLNKGPMTHKKLQKLCYYAQAWFYTLRDEVLINEEFEAWVHGPVSETLYQTYRGSGWSDLSLSADAQLPNLTPEQEELLESVWMTYGDMTGNALEALTHDEMPWKSARAGMSDFVRTRKPISLESMKEYYSSIYEGDEA